MDMSVPSLTMDGDQYRFFVPEQPLQRGGQNPTPSSMPGPINPNLYHDREVEAYSRLLALDSPRFPRMISSVTIAGSDEDGVFRPKLGRHSPATTPLYRPDRHRRRLGQSAQDLPVRGMIMEWIDGPRLDPVQLRATEHLQLELIEAIDQLHGAGIIWGDAQWRNILVRRRPKPSIVVLDFTNARFIAAADVDDDGGGGEADPPRRLDDDETVRLRTGETDRVQTMVGARGKMDVMKA